MPRRRGMPPFHLLFVMRTASPHARGILVRRPCQYSDKKGWGLINRPPKGGLVPPLSGAIATYCPCPLGGGGGGRRPGGVGGLRSKVLHQNGGEDRTCAT